MSDDLLYKVLIAILPVLFAVTIHEAAHGYAARYFGDHTAEQMGRLTLNPMKHIDWFGTLALPLLLYFISNGHFVFGYAKPVPIQLSRMRSPKKNLAWVSFAGPASNFVQAWIWWMVYDLLRLLGWDITFLLDMCQIGVMFNVLLFVFNLFPLPPLDGGRIATSLLPTSWALRYAFIERYGFMIIAVLIFTHVLTDYWIAPLAKISLAILDNWLTPLSNFL